MDSSKEQRFHCTHPGCGASYRRKEHLARHAVRHSQSRVFICGDCGVRFGRNDTLRRHAKIHNKADEPIIPRSSRACNRCHVQKSRCDGNFPCGLCSKKGVLCSFDRINGTRGELQRENAQQRYHDGDHINQDGQVRKRRRLNHLEKDNNPMLAFFNGESRQASIVTSLSDQSVYSVKRALRQQEAQVQHEASRSVDQAILNVPVEGLFSINDEIGLDMTASAIDTEYYVGLYFDHFHPQWPFVFQQAFRPKHEPKVLVLATVMIGLWYTGEARLQMLAWDIHFRLHAMLEAQMETWDKSHNFDLSSKSSGTKTNPHWPMATYQAILLFTIFALIARVPDFGHDQVRDQEGDILRRVQPIFARLIRSCRTQGLLYYPTMLARSHPDDPLIYYWTTVEEMKLFALTLYKVNALFSRLVDDDDDDDDDRDGNNNEAEAQDNADKLSATLSLSDLRFPLPDNGYLWGARPIREWFRRRELQLRDLVPKETAGTPPHYLKNQKDNEAEPWISDILDPTNINVHSKADRRRAWMRLGPWLGFLAGMEPI